MSDLIDRQKAIDAVFELSEKVADEMLFIDAIVDEIENIPSAELETFEFCSGGDNPCKEYDQEKHCCHRWTKVIRQTVEEMKSAEPERKTGTWKPDESGNVYWICSVCGFASEAFGADILYHFCPNCGADMRGE